jgi:predicted phosphodiesterase
LLGSTRRYGEGTFLAYLKESSIDIVCTGHSHYANVSLIEKNNHQPSMLLHAGSLLCKRSRDGLNSYYLIEAKADGCKIAWRVFKNNAFNTITTHDIDFTKNFSTLKGSMHPM